MKEAGNLHDCPPLSDRYCSRVTDQFPPLPRGFAVRPVSPPLDPLLVPPLEPLEPLDPLPVEPLPPDTLGDGEDDPPELARVYPPPRTARPELSRAAESVSPRFTMTTGLLPG